MSRVQTVRDVAYAIWEAEGKPEGRELDHWRQAEARVAASVKSLDAKAPAKGKVSAASGEGPTAKPPAKIAATKAAPANAAKAAPKKAAPKKKS